MTEERKRAELNARIGRLYYMALTDAAGYPNGMPYWPEMTPAEKYYETVTALDFLEKLTREKIITVPDTIGLRKPVMYDQGDCKALLDYFTEVYEKEKAEFEERIAQMNASYRASKQKSEDEEVD